MKPVSKAHLKNQENKIQQPLEDNAVWCHIEALKALRINQDTTAAIRYAELCLKADSLYAPANFILSSVIQEDSVSFAQALEAHQKDTANIHYLENLAQKSIRIKKYDSAIKYYKKLVGKHSNPDHFRILALLHRSFNQPQEALMVLDSAEICFGKYPIFSQMREDIYVDKGEFDKAEQLALQSIKDFPYDADNYTILGGIYERWGRDSIALVTYQKAVKVDSLSIEAWSGLCGFAQRHNDHSRFIDCFLHLNSIPELPLEQKLNNIKTLTSNRKLYREFYPQVDSMHRMLYSVHKTDPEVVKTYTRHLIVSSQAKKASMVWQDYISSVKNPSLEDFCYAVDLENFLNQHNRAMGYIQSAKKQFPDNYELSRYEAATLLMLNQQQKALDVLKMLLKKISDPKKQASIYGAIGDILCKQKKLSSGLDMYEKAVRLNPDDDMILNNYAYVLSENNRELDRALSMSTRVVAKNDKNATYLDTLAWVLYRLGRYDEAKKHMQQAISLGDTDMAVLYLHYGDILFAQGNVFVAKIYWKKALENGYTPATDIEKRINDSEAGK